MSAVSGAEAGHRAARAIARFLLIICAFVLFITPLYAQKITGTISGVVSDPTGAVVANATVTITNVATGLARTDYQRDRGIYRSGTAQRYLSDYGAGAEFHGIGSGQCGVARLQHCAGECAAQDRQRQRASYGGSQCYPGADR